LSRAAIPPPLPSQHELNNNKQLTQQDNETLPGLHWFVWLVFGVITTLYPKLMMGFRTDEGISKLFS